METWERCFSAGVALDSCVKRKDGWWLEGKRECGSSVEKCLSGLH